MNTGMNMKSRKRNFRNFLIRCITRDRYYVCDACNRVHKRDGKEIRLEEDEAKLHHPLCYSMWYKSVSYECYADTFRQLRKIL